MREGNASSTAKVIAASTILLASDRRTAGLVAPQAAQLCEVFLSSSRADRVLARSARQPVTRSLWQGLERLVLPGIMAHYWHRKRWIEQWCRRGIADGFTRIVVLGAGFDTLGCRLAQEFSGLQVIEVDHPATQERKQQALADTAGGAPANLRFLPCDLAGESLPMKAFAGDRPTLVVIEAVLMYLDALDVHRVFQTLRTVRARPLPRRDCWRSRRTQGPVARRRRPRSVRGRGQSAPCPRGGRVPPNPASEGRGLRGHARG